MKFSKSFISKISPLFVTLILILSCNKPSDISSGVINNSELIGCWICTNDKNTEENAYNYLRCETEQLGPARFRMVFELEETNKGKYLKLAPNDAHYFVDCSWSFNPDTNILTISPMNEEAGFNVKVFKIEKNKLLLSTN